MAINPTAPGVYIQEISTLPPSVAPVATAIPAFIGYTEKGPANKATRITSMLEFETVFGGAYNEQFEVKIEDAAVITDPPVISIEPASITGLKNNVLYYNMQMYFANGGGPCYVISVGAFKGTMALTDFFNVGTGAGIEAAEKVDEITLLVAPEVVYLSDGDRLAVYDAMLAQCNKLQDRFAILDVEKTGAGANADVNAFRTTNVGNNFLKYGAAYYPSLQTVLSRAYLESEVLINDTRGTSVFDVEPRNSMSAVYYGQTAYAPLTITDPVGAAAPAGSITINGYVLTAGVDFVSVNADLAATATNIAAAIAAHPVLGTLVYGRKKSDVGTSGIIYILAKDAITLTVSATSNFAFGAVVNAVANTQNRALHARIKDLLGDVVVTLYPSASMAGIYAAVDRTRGVWKAPANTSLSLVKEPTVILNEDENGDMNIDASGKSVNAIRKFVGKGTIVWGARTLAGNDNEWRYVNVRRYFNYAEESIKKATESVVFEPNDANTWLRVKGTVTNFLTNEWRNGALVGAKPEHAFFVKVGLNETMTAQDILEGKLIIQIGLAVSRPAEFIILQFMHKLQES